MHLNEVFLPPYSAAFSQGFSASSEKTFCTKRPRHQKDLEATIDLKKKRWQYFPRCSYLPPPLPPHSCAGISQMWKVPERDLQLLTPQINLAIVVINPVSNSKAAVVIRRGKPSRSIAALHLNVDNPQPIHTYTEAGSNPQISTSFRIFNETQRRRCTIFYDDEAHV